MFGFVSDEMPCWMLCLSFSWQWVTEVATSTNGHDPQRRAPTPLAKTTTSAYDDTTTTRLVFKGSVQSGFLPRKRATVDRNRSRTDPDIEGTEPNHLGPVFCGP
ncbi:uncharacterized protein LACBIDRAFT_328051 [Laccaria bicolor S238N-H82]|uniref:Predicted protein n=1 Tax=Laccaria bicolor (strain S238N-H82 / ATCC MYA-4686) TaxID=486041 RepID=B0DDL4_LACBS|nr:uncharacterized protein LACBIDRAFT_328051 [Laccaria bicolor S238N-H82]EDR07109.1 predicted protein [Laccaria bicolor S238N-H82]|eukprot:XP_001882040.1 predicted protein [Laccaria bicolor S238N-H82]